jgi:hypothetical protein
MFVLSQAVRSNSSRFCPGPNSSSPRARRDMMTAAIDGRLHFVVA